MSTKLPLPLSSVQTDQRQSSNIGVRTLHNFHTITQNVDILCHDTSRGALYSKGKHPILSKREMYNSTFLHFIF